MDEALDAPKIVLTPTQMLALKHKELKHWKFRYQVLAQEHRKANIAVDRLLVRTFRAEKGLRVLYECMNDGFSRDRIKTLLGIMIEQWGIRAPRDPSATETEELTGEDVKEAVNNTPHE